MTHDVFLNFRGKEMRKTFVSHLLSSFTTKNITSFIVSDPFEDPDLKAMEQSLVAIPVISKNYVISNLWMDDLRKIIECEKIGTLTAIPIFFQVSPLDILHATEKYADTQDETLEMVRKWLYAQVSRKPSFHSNDWDDDSELVDKITSFVSDILESSTSSYQSTGLSPAPSLKLESAFRVSKFMHWRSLSLPSSAFTPISLSAFSQFPLLDMKGRLENLRAMILRVESRAIGICGMEGVGKTTLARHLYEEMAPRFQHHIYIKNVINRSQCPFSLLDMLASETFKESSFRGSSDSVECPRYEEALAFFSEFAFKQSSPLPVFESLSFRAVHVANRLPLALKVLGSYLRDREIDEWESTLRKLEASRDNYASEVKSYIGADDYAPRRPIKVDRHIGVDEANCFPLYCLALE
ncbi:hypothetical protein ARALYDRAFT_895140 [Arabidopsis lyrata subsp. lyrata]|uniref:TIR domain-containing protein n=1 Tax=Arabidopsis lyrata subsp. lyrata TaxID=81972 RepID=D7KR46_ARALL|nr:hypothetical protein ARALYDRAFT_895140 [Arabidopsis lyrata subsp. lyrata]